MNFQDKASAYFEQHPTENEFLFTSDGMAFMNLGDADAHAAELSDKSIETYKRGGFNAVISPRSGDCDTFAINIPHTLIAPFGFILGPSPSIESVEAMVTTMLTEALSQIGNYSIEQSERLSAKEDQSPDDALGTTGSLNASTLPRSATDTGADEGDAQEDEPEKNTSTETEPPVPAEILISSEAIATIEAEDAKKAAFKKAAVKKAAAKKAAK